MKIVERFPLYARGRDSSAIRALAGAIALAATTAGLAR